MNLAYTLRLADDALIIGHRLSEWCGHGPILEQDIALTNTALDHLGRARSLCQYAAEQYNAATAEEKKNSFSSVAIQQLTEAGKQLTEDDIAYLRDGWDYRSLLLLEQPNIDWAFTVARAFYYDTFNYYFFSHLKNSNDTTLAAIAEKSLKEVTYHLRWSSEWVVRLGDGTDESHNRIQQAINELWQYTGEPFVMNDADNVAVSTGAGVNLADIQPLWTARIAEILQEATLTMPPAGSWMQQGGKEGRHTEHLGYILAEMQYMQRTYPGMEW